MQPDLFSQSAPPASEPDPDDPMPEGWPSQLVAAGIGPRELARRQTAHIAARREHQRLRGLQSLQERLQDGLRPATASGPAPADGPLPEPPAPSIGGPGSAPAAHQDASGEAAS